MVLPLLPLMDWSEAADVVYNRGMPVAGSH
jgi:hypothetical protein